MIHGGNKHTTKIDIRQKVHKNINHCEKRIVHGQKVGLYAKKPIIKEIHSIGPKHVHTNGQRKSSTKSPTIKLA